MDSAILKCRGDPGSNCARRGWCTNLFGVGGVLDGLGIGYLALLGALIQTVGKC
jgi:hypothetical protein